MITEISKEKEAYEAAKMELIRIDARDVIVTSAVSGTGTDNPPDESNWDTWT